MLLNLVIEPTDHQLDMHPTEPPRSAHKVQEMLDTFYMEKFWAQFFNTSLA